MDIIQLLPDSVANQIAAGEVVQRPASVVKELMENAVDAGASVVQVLLKNVGKTLIQVVDDGKGMSPMDARMAFERHATSKIAAATDLFNIHTLGFRGEALPSIASVAEVELKSRRNEDELGTYVNIVASELKEQSVVNMPQGTNIGVKNLFFNIPVRRKFLKSDATELKNIVTEFQRVALAYPEIAFSLTDDEKELYNLPIAGLRPRIASVFGKQMNGKLLAVDCDTALLKIKGFVLHPQFARRTYGEQYFFVNNRFMKHSYFHRAVQEAFSGLISSDCVPSYFLYFTVNPSLIDVNIHPTKTEIKFQNETDFFQILMAGIKEALGKFNVTPPMDFDHEGDPGYVGNRTSKDFPSVPRVNYNPSYNPFNSESRITPADSNFEEQKNGGEHKSFEERSGDLSRPQEWREQVPSQWESLFEGLKEKEPDKQLVLSGLSMGSENENDTDPDSSIGIGASSGTNGATNIGGNINTNAYVGTRRALSPQFLQMKGRYIITTIHSGLLFINQKRASERILFDKNMNALAHQRVCGQKCLFPETVELQAGDFALIQEIHADLEFLGFELCEFGKDSFALYATPPGETYAHGRELLLQLLEYYKNTEGDIKGKAKERIALALAKAAAIPYNTPLSAQEMNDLVDSLFACALHNFTADGKTIIHTLELEEVNRWFK
ncbi:DNA mismatch repair protein MutL [Bacteroidia bacterium]|nr:DNA mismatch repair protein MutL [Bacteroidia bacterium]